MDDSGKHLSDLSDFNLIDTPLGDGSGSTGRDLHRTTLDTITDAVFYLNADGRAVWMNRAARALSRQMAPFKLDGSQRLRASDGPLDAQILEICRRRSPHSMSFVIDTRTRTGSLHVGRILVGNHEAIFPERGDQGVSVVVVVHVTRSDSGWLEVIGYFGVSTAEAELAADMVHGLTLDQCALRRGRSIHTVRNQLRSLLAKTGTNRQSELVGLLAPFATPRPLSETGS